MKIYKTTSYDNKSIQEKEYEDTVFRNCSFIETSFKKCQFINCKFESCRISALELTNSMLVDTSFSDSKVEGVDWTNAEIIRSISFENCVLNYSNFSMLKLPGIKIINCEAKEVYFSEADFREADFSGTDLEKAIFCKTNLVKANFINARNYWIDVTQNKLVNARFSLPDAVNLLKPLGIKVD